MWQWNPRRWRKLANTVMLYSRVRPMWQQILASLAVVGALVIVVTLCPAVMSTLYDDGLYVLWSCKLQSSKLPIKCVHSPVATSARTPRPVASFEGSHFGQNTRAIQGRCQGSPPLQKHADSVVGVAFLFLVHSAETLAGMVDTIEELWHASDTFVIHLDAKLGKSADLDLFESVVQTCLNIHFTQKKFDVQWGDATILDAELELVTTAGTLNHPWLYAFILDGSAFPITTRRVRTEWLDSMPPDSNGVLIDPLQGICSSKEADWRPYCYRTPARCLDANCTSMTETPGNAPVYRGAQWVWISRQFATHLSTSEDTAAWRKFFEGTSISDELFFPTVLHASSYRGTSVVGVHIYTDWEDDCRSHVNKRPHDSPCYLGEADVSKIMSSGLIFARKFSADEPARYTIRKALASAEK